MHKNIALELPSIERLNEAFSYDHESGIVRWKISIGSRAKAGNVAGCKNKDGYLVVRLDGALMLLHRVVFAIHYGAWPEKHIDHIDCDKSNNKIENIREATIEENNRNQRISKDNASGYKGVYLHEGTKKWCAEIRFKRKKYYLGLFEDIKEAHKAYCDAAKKLHGEFWRAR